MAVGSSPHVSYAGIFWGGNEHDSTHALASLSKVSIAGSVVLADKAYGSRAIRDFIDETGATYCIPPKSNDKNPWDYDRELCKERHLVECFFQKLKK